MYITKKKFRERTYYYIVENKIIDSRPTMKHVMYLGNVEKILNVFRNFKKKKS